MFMSRVTMLIGVSFLMVGLYIDSWMVFLCKFFLDYCQFHIFYARHSEYIFKRCGRNSQSFFNKTIEKLIRASEMMRGFLNLLSMYLGWLEHWPNKLEEFF